jgi:hypothetical protein
MLIGNFCLSGGGEYPGKVCDIGFETSCITLGSERCGTVRLKMSKSGGCDHSKYRPDHVGAALGGLAHLNLTCGIRWVCDAQLCIETQCNL